MTSGENSWAIVHLGVFHIVLSALFVIPQYRFYGWDSLDAYRFTIMIFQKDVTTTEVIPTPLLHIHVGMVQSVLGIPISIAVKYVPLAISTIGIIALCIFIYQRFSLQLTVLGGLFMSSVWFPTAFHVMSVKESLAIPILLLFLVAVLRSYQDRRFFPLAFILLIAITFTHDMSAFFLVILTAIILLAEWIILGENLSIRSTPTIFHGQRYGIMIFILSMIVLLLHWVYFHQPPLFHFLSIFTEYSISPEVTDINSDEPLLLFTSLRTKFQLLWRGGLIHFPQFSVISGQVLVTGGVILYYLISQIKRKTLSSMSIRIRTNPIILISIGGLLFFIVLAGVASFAGSVGPRRFVGYSWIFVVPILIGLFSWSAGQNHIQTIILMIIVINLLSFPVHVLSPTMHANYESGELGFGYEKSDYTTAEWLSTYGEQQVASDEKYTRLFKKYDIKLYPNFRLLWLVDDSYKEPPGVYIYQSNSYNEFLLTRAGWTRHPVELKENYGYNRVYNSGGVVYSTPSS
ncbi:hypothetical protein [Halomontanus rarus]|uniref:hypothetical protein n=1 Tax=Halomontanus rarus TaxID=3034020 RepID=UPI00307CB278